MKLGIISDTHGLLRPEAVAALQGVDYILHAGDTGMPEILDQLRAIAPLQVVRGNVDRGEWAQALPLTEAVELGGHLFYMVHRIEDLDLDPVAAGVSMVVFGHSHQPEIKRREGVWYLNPGSAGPRRFSLPVTLALLEVSAESLRPEIVHLL
ncbi:MAG: metallophosphoesterase [Bacteroidetes bacterium]|nr:MAG: metallophosphoesterase [Bacteroidota bacterium]